MLRILLIIWLRRHQACNLLYDVYKPKSWGLIYHMSQLFKIAPILVICSRTVYIYKIGSIGYDMN
jgi:hypothetical protein